jgi:hypothetical protein
MNSKNIEIGDIVIAPNGINRTRDYGPDYKDDPPSTTYKILAIWPNYISGNDWFLIQADNGFSVCYDRPHLSAEEINYESFDVEEEGLPGMLDAIKYCKVNRLNVWEIGLADVELFEKE